MGAWNQWYHVNGSTYGTWLPGDPRGWRSRGHREHVEGEYRHPPAPGTYDGLHAKAKDNRKWEPVHLSVPQRQLAGQALVEMLIHLNVEVLVLSLDALHYHVLARFPSAPGKDLVGRAKKHAYFVLRAHGHKAAPWATGSKLTPVRDRQHQVNVYHYILDHAQDGAWTWTYKEGVYWEPTVRPKPERGEE